MHLGVWVLKACGLTWPEGAVAIGGGVQAVHPSDFGIFISTDPQDKKSRLLSCLQLKCGKELTEISGALGEHEGACVESLGSGSLYLLPCAGPGS